MSDDSVTRRGLLRTTGGLAAAGLVGGLSGCSQVSNTIQGGSGSSDTIQAVPEDSEYIFEVDFAAIYEDQALRDGINEQIEQARDEIESEGIPESVTAALDQIEDESGLDPRLLSKSILSGAYDAATEYDQAAYTLWTEWTEDDILDAIEEANGSYSEDDHEDKTLYVFESGSGEQSSGQPSEPPVVLAVLEEGVFSVGTRAHVEATIETWIGEEDPVEGEVRSGYDAATAGHVRFAFDVITDEIPEQASAEIDTSLAEEVTYGYGSLSADGDDRVASLSLETENGETATDIRDIMQGTFVIMERQADNSDIEDKDELVAALEATEFSSSGTTTSVTHTRPASDFAAVLTPLLLAFAMPQGSSEFGSEMDTEPRAPIVSLGFEYETDEQVLTITHESGETVSADELWLRGDGFVPVDGVDQTGPGPWQGSHDEDGSVRAGDSVTVGAASDYDVRVVWESASGGQSATLSQDLGPNA